MDKLQNILHQLRTEKAIKDIVVETLKSPTLVQVAQDGMHGGAGLPDVIQAHSAMDGAGTPATGYALPDCGPFRCDHCIHIDKGGDCCNHPKVIADPDVPTKEEGGKKVAVVHPDSCCNYFHPQDGHESE